MLDNRRGRKLPIDAQGVWIRQSHDPRGFRPETYSPAEWNRPTPEEKEEVLTFRDKERHLRHNEEDEEDVSDGEPVPDAIGGADPEVVEESQNSVASRRHKGPKPENFLAGWYRLLDLV